MSLRGDVLTSSSDQRQCVLAESLSYASTSGGSSGLLSCSRIVSAGKKRSNQNWHGPVLDVQVSWSDPGITVANHLL